MGCGGQILESDDFLMKVVIRADMTCVVQIATLDFEGEDARETERNLVSYLRVMQFMLERAS